MKASGLLAIGIAALVTLVPSTAAAKGSTMSFDESSYAVGDTAIGQATVQTWPGNEPDNPPFDIYLVEGTQPLWYHHLPKKAIRVGTLSYEQLGPESYSVEALFKVPNIEGGTYAVWVCNVNCRAGFGDLVDGSIEVVGSSRSEPKVPSPSAGGAVQQRTEPSQSSWFTPGWLLAAGVVLALAALVLFAWRRVRHVG